MVQTRWSSQTHSKRVLSRWMAAVGAILVAAVGLCAQTILQQPPEGVDPVPGINIMPSKLPANVLLPDRGKRVSAADIVSGIDLRPDLSPQPRRHKIPLGAGAVSRTHDSKISSGKGMPALGSRSAFSSAQRGIAADAKTALKDKDGDCSSSGIAPLDLCVRYVDLVTLSPRHPISDFYTGECFFRNGVLWGD